MPRKSKSKSEDPNHREVLHPEVLTMVCVDDQAINEERAKEILGWMEETEDNKFGEDFWFKDLHGTKIRCYHNVTKGYTNRPLIMGNVMSLRQEILNGRWHLNGEPIILGKHGLVLNGQHTLIALVTACQAYKDDPEAYPAWDEAPKIDKIITVGIDESDEVVNTMDTGKPRSLADVIYRSSHFADVTKASDKQKLAKVLEYAVSFLWKRTAAGGHVGVRRTHSEALDFIERHPKILECAKFVFSENTGKNRSSQETEKNRITRYISLGYAAGLMYLMGSSKSNWGTYSSNPCEEELDWSLFDTACTFWSALANSDKSVVAVKKGMETEKWGGSVNEKVALIVHAWKAYADSHKVTPSQVKLNYVTDEDGFHKLDEQPICGGIDIGDPSNWVREPDLVDSMPEGYEPNVGDEVWVSDPSGNHWNGTLESIDDSNPTGVTAMVKCGEGYGEESGESFEVLYNQLRPESPDTASVEEEVAA